MALSDWQNRQNLSISAADIGSNLSDFPLFISLNGHVIFDVLNDFSLRKKMAFFDSAGSEYVVELVGTFDPENRKGAIVVRSNLVTGLDNTFTLAFDKNHTDNLNVKDPFQSPGFVYGFGGNNYKFAYLMAQDPFSSVMYDSVGTYPGSPNGGMDSTNLVDGLTSNAIEFNGTNQYYSSNTANPNLTGLAGATWTIMMKPGGVAPGGRVFAKSLGAPNLGWEIVRNADNAVEIGVSSDGSAWTWTASADDLVPDDEWHIVTFVWDGSFICLFIDGIEAISGGFPFAFSAADINGSGQNLYLANNQQNPDTFGGQIQHASLSNIERSDDWVYAEALSHLGQIVRFDNFFNGKIVRLTRFQFTLTGTADSMTNVTLPCSNFQVTRNPGGSTTLQLTVPDALNNADFFTDRPNGTLIITAIYDYTDGTTTTFEVVRVPFLQIIPHYGGVSTSLQVSGDQIDTYPPGGTKRLPGVNYQSSSPAGNLTVRLAALAITVQPNDTIVYLTPDGVDTSFVAAKINMSVSGDTQSMTLTE